MSKRTLHRALAACGETFGAMLIQARVDLAVRMLRSPLFDRVTTAEIGRRAGFSDASHFVEGPAQARGPDADADTPRQTGQLPSGSMSAPGFRRSHSAPSVAVSRARRLPRRADRKHDRHHDGDNCHDLKHARETQPCHERAPGDGAKRITDVVDRPEHTVGGAVSGMACDVGDVCARSCRRDRHTRGVGQDDHDNRRQRGCQREREDGEAADRQPGCDHRSRPTRSDTTPMTGRTVSVVMAWIPNSQPS